MYVPTLFVQLGVSAAGIGLGAHGLTSGLMKDETATKHASNLVKVGVSVSALHAAALIILFLLSFRMSSVKELPDKSWVVIAGMVVAAAGLVLSSIGNINAANIVHATTDNKEEVDYNKITNVAALSAGMGALAAFAVCMLFPKE